MEYEVREGEGGVAAFRDFLDPKWRGGFALNAIGGVPFDLLSLEPGAPEALGPVRRLLANRPILKNGTPAVGSAVTTGDRQRVARSEARCQPADFMGWLTSIRGRRCTQVGQRR